MDTNGNTKAQALSLREKGGLVESLWHAVDGAAGNLENVPGLVRRVLITGAWQKRVQDGETYEHERFIDFITSKPLAGCGWPPDKVEALIKSDAETLTLWRKAVKEKTGPKPLGNYRNIVTKTISGNSKSYALSRLKLDYSELYQRVVDGELSANAAAIQAGFRKKLTTLEKLQKEWAKATSKERKTFLKWAVLLSTE